MVSSCPLRYVHIFSPTALSSLKIQQAHATISAAVTTQQICEAHSHKTRLDFCYFISILLPFSSFQQLTINGFQVTPILVALFFSIDLYHNLLKMIFFFIVFSFLYHQFFRPSIRLTDQALMVVVC